MANKKKGIATPGKEQTDEKTLINGIVGSLGALIYDDIQVKDPASLFQKVGTKSVLNRNIGAIVDNLKKIDFATLGKDFDQIKKNIEETTKSLSNGIIYKLLDKSNAKLFKIEGIINKQYAELLFAKDISLEMNKQIISLNNKLENSEFLLFKIKEALNDANVIDKNLSKNLSKMNNETSKKDENIDTEQHNKYQKDVIDNIVKIQTILTNGEIYKLLNDNNKNISDTSKSLININNDIKDISTLLNTNSTKVSEINKSLTNINNDIKDISTLLNTNSTKVSEINKSLLNNIEQVKQIFTLLNKNTNIEKNINNSITHIIKQIDNKNIVNILNKINKFLLKNNNRKNNKNNKLIIEFNNIKSLTDFIKFLNKVNIDKKTKQLQKLFNLFDSAKYSLARLNNFEKSTKSLINSIELISNLKLDKKTLNYLYKNSDKLIKLINKKFVNLSYALTKLSKASNKIKNPKKTFTTLQTSINGLNGMMNNMPSKKSIFGTMAKLPKLLTIIESMTKTIVKLSGMNSKISKGFKALNKVTSKLITVVNKYNKIDDKTVDKAIKINRSLLEFVAGSALILIIGGLLMTFINIGDLLTFTATLLGFTGALLYICKFLIKRKGTIEGAGLALQGLARLVVFSGLILLLGGFVMQIIDITDLLLFTGVLFGFILGMMLIFKFLLASKKVMRNAVILLGVFNKTILITAIILMIAGLLGKMMDWKSVFLFVGALALFLLSVSLIYIFLAKAVKKSLRIAGEFIILVAVSGLLLLAAGLISSIIDWKGLGIFVVSLAGFIKAICKIYSSNSKKITGAFVPSREFALLVLMSGLILVIGGLAMRYISILDLITFAGILLIFVSGITWVYKRNSTDINKAFPSAIEFGVLVAICAGVLLAGGLIMKYINVLDLLAFAGILLVFVAGITFVYKRFGRDINSAFPKAIEFGALVAICAGVLLIGGGLFTAYPDLWIGTLEFLGLLLVLVGGLAGICYILSKFQSDLKKGAILMAIIVAIAAGGALVITLIGAGIRGVSMGALWNAVAVMIVIILAIGGLAIGLGVLLSNPVMPVVMAIGLAFLTAMVGIMLLVATAMKSIGEAMLLASIATGGGDIDYSIIIDMATASVDIAAALAGMKDYASVIPICSFAAITMSIALSVIAQTVADYAALKVPIYKGKDVVGYRELKHDDFKNAAVNVKTIITVLGKAIIDTYNKNPEMFQKQGAFAKLGGGSTKFEIVVESLKALGPLISSIARGIQNYANLKYAIAWDKSGNPIKFKSLKNDDFKNAAKNIKYIIVTLAKAIIDTYNKNPHLFAQPSYGIFGNGKSIFDKVTKSLKALGPLISSISNGLKDYADLKFPIKWNKEGKAIEFQRMTNIDFQNAAKNISLIITTLSKAIIDTYNKNPHLFAQPSYGIFGNGKSIFDKVTKSLKALGPLISEISNGIKDYANLTYPIKWNKDGKPIDFERLTDKDFQNAAKNIKLIITTLSNTLIKIYEEHPELFEDDDDSKFNIVLNSCMKLGDLISNIASGIQNYANLTYPIKWNKDGKPIDFKTLEPQDFTNAAKNLELIITTISTALITIYENHPELYEDEEDSKIFTIMKSSESIGKLIANIGGNITSLATAMIPIKWNKDGKAIEFKKIDSGVIDKAGEEVSTVITTVSLALIKTYEDYPELFENKKDSKIFTIMNSQEKIGKIIKNIAESIANYATKQFPIEWNKEGKPLKFKNIDEGVIKEAGKGIADLITAVGTAITETYTNNEELFDDGEDSKFFIATKSVETMSKGIKGIADTVIAFGTAQYPTEWDPKTGKPIKFGNLNKETFIEASKGIKEVITTVGGAIKDTFNTDLGREMFNDPSVWDTYFGCGDEANSFSRVVNGLMNMSKMMKNIVDSVVKMAGSEFPTKWNEKGEPIGFDTVNEKVMIEAANGVKAVITTVGGAIKDLYNTDLGQEMFNDPSVWTTIFCGDSENPFSKVVAGLVEMSKMMKNIVDSVVKMAGSEFPTKWNEEGEPIDFDNVDKDVMQKAADGVKAVVETVGKAIIELYNTPKGQVMFNEPYKNANSPFVKTTKGLKEMGTMIKNIADGIGIYATKSYVSEWNPDGSPKSRKPFDKDIITKASEQIATIITTIGGTIAELSIGNIPNKNLDARAKRDIQNLFKNGGFFGGGDSSFVKTARAMAQLGSMVANFADGISALAKTDIKAFFEKTTVNIDGDWTAPDFTFEESNFDVATRNIKKLIICVAGAVHDVYETNKKTYFNMDDYEDLWKIMGTIGNIVSGVAAGISSLAETGNSPAIASAGDNIKNVIYAVVNGVKQAYDSLGTDLTSTTSAEAGASLGSFSLGGKVSHTSVTGRTFKPALEIANVLNQILTLTYSVADITTSIAAGSIPEKIDPKTGQVISYVKINDESLGKLKKTLTMMLHLPFDVFLDKSPIYNNGFGDYISSISLQAKIQSVTNILELYNSVFSNIANAISNVINIFKDNAKKLEFLSNGKINFEQLSEALESIKKIAHVIGESFDIMVGNDVLNSPDVIGVLFGGEYNAQYRKTIQRYESISHTVSLYANVINCFTEMSNNLYDLLTSGKLDIYKEDSELWDSVESFKENAHKLKNIFYAFNEIVQGSVGADANVTWNNLTFENTKRTIDNLLYAITCTLEVLPHVKKISDMSINNIVYVGKGSHHLIFGDKFWIPKSMVVFIDTVNYISEFFKEVQKLTLKVEKGKVKQFYNLFDQLLCLNKPFLDVLKIPTNNIIKIGKGSHYLIFGDKFWIPESVVVFIDTINYMSIFLDKISSLNIIISDETISSLFRLCYFMKYAAKILSSIDKYTIYFTWYTGNSWDSRESKISLNIIVITQTIEYICKNTIKSINSYKEDIQNAVKNINFLNKILIHMFAYSIILSKISKNTIHTFSTSDYDSYSYNIYITGNTIKYLISDLIPIINSNEDEIKQAVVSFNNLFDITRYMANIVNIISYINNSGFISENDILSNFESTINNIKAVFSSISDINKTYNPSDVKLLKENSDILVNIAKNISIINNELDGDKNGISVLELAIHGINRIVDEISDKSIEKLQKETSSLEKYTKTINSLQTYKVDKLINMINSMNKLSSNIGNLDKFTYTLTHMFSGVVEKLALQIKEAQTTIISIDKREEKRKNKIKDYLKKLDNIMKEKLIVEVTQGAVEDSGYSSFDDGEQFSDDSGEIYSDKKDDSEPGDGDSYGGSSETISLQKIQKAVLRALATYGVPKNK